MPEDKDQIARKAVAGVKDEATFIAAYNALKEMSDINAVGASGKSALNFAVEKYLLCITSSDRIYKEASQFKFTMIQLLLNKGADISKLKHAETDKLQEETESRFKALFNQMNSNVANKINSLSGMTALDLHFICTFHLFKEMFEINNRVNTLQATYAADPVNQDELESKLILICEDHEDYGTTEFLTGLAPSLLPADYKCICLEQPFETDLESIANESHDNPFYRKVKFAMRPEFKPYTKCIDPGLKYAGDVIKAIDIQARDIMGADILNPLRDKGLTYSLLLAAKEHKGRVIGIIGAAHAHGVIPGLNGHLGGCIAICPTTEPELHNLRTVANGSLVIKDGCDDQHTLNIFNVLKVQPLDLRPHAKNAVVKDFAAKHLPEIKVQPSLRNKPF